MSKKYISYRRVSTHKQRKSGLGLESQEAIIRYFVERDRGDIIKDYCETYTGKDLAGCKELQKAINHAKSIGAVLIIAKTDRFRNTAEALAIYEQMGDGNIVFCDLPSTDKFTLTLMFAIAEREALMISLRTKQALAAKKARGETWVRNSDTTKAIIQSAKNKIARAKANPTNVFFYNYVMQFEKRNGRLDPKDKEGYQKLADELNGLGQRTVTGLPYTKTRCQGLVIKMRKRFKC